MVEKGTMGSSDTAHPLINKVLASKPPSAELVGFDVEEVSDGRAVGYCSQGHNTRIPWALFMVACCVIWQMRPWGWLSRPPWHRTSPSPQCH